MKTPVSRRALISLLAIVAALVTIAASCDEEAAEETSAEVSAETGDGEASESVDAGGDDAGTEEQAAAGGEEFCAAAAEVDSALDSFDLVSLTPEDLESTMTDTLTKMQNAAELAPDDIRPAIETSEEGFSLMNTALAEANYNLLDFDLAVLDQLDADPKYNDAADELSVYLFEQCGLGTDPALDVDTDAETGTDAPGLEGTAREQIVTQLVATGFTEAEATCLAETPDLLEVMTSADSTAILAAFESCGIPPERLLELGGATG